MLLGVALLGLFYLSLMYAWIVATGSLDPPHYIDARRALRQFFAASILVLLVLWALNFARLRNLCARHPPCPSYLMMTGALMAAAGVAGMLVVLPLWGELSQPGGLTPDFGHTLTYQNFTGALWLFMLGGVAPYTVGYFATPRPRLGWLTAGLLMVAVVPIYFIGYAVYVIARLVAAP